MNSILSIIFPAKCAACGAAGTDLCVDCLHEAPVAERECASWVFPLFDYRHAPIKKCIRLMKYKGRKTLAKTFAEIMHGRIMEELADLYILKNFRDPVLIPIPLSAKRRRERGYNQAELLCEEIIKIEKEIASEVSRTVLDTEPRKQGIWGKKSGGLEMLVNVLVKTKETEHQARIKNRSERLANLRGTFAVKNKELVKGRNVILIDDVVTTGGTLSEARKTLRLVGARQIIAFTIAH